MRFLYCLATILNTIVASHFFTTWKTSNDPADIWTGILLMMFAVLNLHKLTSREKI